MNNFFDAIGIDLGILVVMLMVLVLVLIVFEKVAAIAGIMTRYQQWFPLW